MKLIFKLLFCIFFHILFLQNSVSSHKYYCWRDYTGKIPMDAVSAGEDSNGTAFIGQAIAQAAGCLSGVRLYPGTTEVAIPCYGYQTTSINVKILCSKNSTNLQWIPTNSGHYSRDILHKKPLQAGWDYRHRYGMLHIGRIWYKEQLIIGVIGAYDTKNTTFYFPYDNKELRAYNYEVLVFQKQPKGTADNSTL